MARGERYCDRCGPQNEVLMRFERYFEECSVIFEAGDRIVRKVKLATAERGVEMARQGDGIRTPGDRRALNAAILTGRGEMTLHLTVSQFARLKEPTHRPRRRRHEDNTM
jgi:hypothetical protein